MRSSREEYDGKAGFVVCGLTVDDNGGPMYGAADHADTVALVEEMLATFREVGSMAVARAHLSLAGVLCHGNNPAGRT